VTAPALAAAARALLRAQFGREPLAECFAPGRVNLVGEHTDYNGGFVLPMALGCGTAVAAAPRADREIVAVSATGAGLQHERFLLGGAPAPAPRGWWGNYLRGMVAEMHEAGVGLAGANLAIVADVPQGAGLSSSASLSVALGRALLAAAAAAGAGSAGDTAHPSDPAAGAAALARWAQSTEHRYAGCRCGIMDPMAAAVAAPGEAILLDCRDLRLERLALPEGWVVLVADSGVRRELVAGEYNLRRQQCEDAAHHYGVATLRELDPARLVADRGALAGTAFRRARHVVAENARVKQAATALATRDLAAFGRALRGSHESLRDDFEVTVPQLDALADHANALVDAQAAGRGGARMTGGGFGGCVVAVVDASAATPLARGLEAFTGRPLVAALGKGLD
jgi:galactokinase